MTRDDIIRMAREAGIIHPEMVDKTLERFADLVAAHERERVMQVAQSMKADLEARFETVYMEGAMAGAIAEREKVARWQIGSGYSTGHGETIEDLLVELEWQVRESEREACAGLCQWKTGVRPVDAAIETCAAAIRARGETK